MGGGGPVDSWDGGGRWLMSVFRVDMDTIVGFFHAEVRCQFCKGLHTCRAA